MKQELGNLMAEDPHQETINLLNYRLNAVITERDRLDDQLDEILLRLGRTQEKMFDAERQRDRLAEALNKYRGQIDNEGNHSAPEALQSLNQPKQ